MHQQMLFASLAGISGYTIENAVWFDGSADYLSRTPAVAGNRRTWTWSSWVKRANLTGANQPLFTSGGDDWILFLSGETLGINTDGSSNYRIVTSQLFRDPLAWFHVVIAVDTTNSTAGNRLRMYINGSEVTAFGTDTNPALNYETTTNNTTEHNIGKLIGASQYFDGYLADVHYVDGAALTADDFGETDDNGVWVPIEYVPGTPDSALSVSHTADAVSSSDLTTYTFSSQAIGTANAARVIAVGTNINGGHDPQGEISAITVGGVSLSQASKHQRSTSHSDEIWYGTVPTGTSADVVVTVNQATDRCAIDVWNVGNGAELYASGDAGGNAQDTVSTTIAVPDGSVTVAHGHYSNTSATWTGLTENSDRHMETTTYAGGASVATASATNLTVTLDATGSVDQSFAAATFAPASNGAYGTNGYYLNFTVAPGTGSGAGTDANGSALTDNASTSAQWVGDTGDFSFTADDITGATDKEIHLPKYFSGNFDVQYTLGSGSNYGTVGIYDAGEAGTIQSSGGYAGMDSMTDSWYLYEGASNTMTVYYGGASQTTFAYSDGAVIRITRVGSTITVYEDDVSQHAYSQTFAGPVGLAIGGHAQQAIEAVNWTVDSYGNHFTDVSMTAAQQVTDTATDSVDDGIGNYCTANPIGARLHSSMAQDNSSWTWTNGNLTGSHTASGGDSAQPFTQLLHPGKKYHFEYTLDAAEGIYAAIVTVLCPLSHWEATAANPSTQTGSFFASIANGSSVSNSAKFSNSTITAPTNKQSNGDRATFEVDMSTIGSTQIKLFYNGSLDTTWSSMAFTDEPYVLAWSSGTETDRDGTCTWNFGQSGFDDTPTTDFVGLSTATMAAPAITDPSAHFKPIIYEGTGAELSTGDTDVEALDFQPDFVWIKNRDADDSHMLYDSVRGATNDLHSDLADAETTTAQTLKSFDANGFTLGTDVQVNTNNESYIAWSWKAGGAPSADNSENAGDAQTADSVKIDGANGSSATGTIAVTRASANTTAGFSVVAYEGLGSAGTVPHFLTAAPEFIIAKNRDVADGWAVLHMSAGASQELSLHSNGAASTNSVIWDSGSGNPTDEFFRVGTSDRTSGSASSESIIAYCWHSVAGFSKIGTYTAASSAGDDTYVHLGFTPSFIMIKNKDNAENWVMWDTARSSTGNPIDDVLYANSTAVEATANYWRIDVTAGGFKIRADPVTGGVNQHTATGGYLYAAFAESPSGGDGVAQTRAR